MPRYEEEEEFYEDSDKMEFRIRFASPGSALRAASKTNPRNLPCPTCKRENLLTPADQALGYQCDSCVDFSWEEGY